MSNPFLRAGIGSLLVGAGLALLVSSFRAVKPCEDCEEDPVETIEDVAEASASLSEEPETAE